MSDDYRLQKKVSIEELSGGRLKKYGIRAHLGTTDPASSRMGYLTDGSNSLSMSETRSGEVELYSRGNPDYILRSVAEEFKTEFYCEDQPQFWGFDSEDEMFAEIAAHKKHGVTENSVFAYELGRSGRSAGRRSSPLRKQMNCCNRRKQSAALRISIRCILECGTEIHIAVC